MAEHRRVLGDHPANALHSDDALAPGGRLAILASGLWLFDEQSQGAAGAPIVVHGANTASTARLAVFVANPLYRADPEREWPALASAMLLADE